MTSNLSGNTLFLRGPAQPTADREKENELIRIAQEEMEYLFRKNFPSAMFFLTDASGMILDVRTNSEELERRLATNRIGPGVRFTSARFGRNAVASAVKSGTLAVVRDFEHDAPLFRDWTCICMPIRISDKPIGFLDLSFLGRKDLDFAVPLVECLCRNVEHRLSMRRFASGPEKWRDILQKYGLTPREIDVAIGWLMNHTVRQIADRLAISGATVRTVLKNIYRKTGASSKGDLFHLLMFE